MGKALGIVGLVLGAIGIVLAILLGMVVYRLTLIFLIPTFVIAAIAIVFGIIGMVKDDSKGIKIAGVVLGAISVGLILSVFFLLRYMDYIWPVY